MESISLKEQGVKSLKGFGFVNVTIDNIMSDEVYRFFFGRFLVTKKGEDKKINEEIEKLLNLITKGS
jgi:hypothetical protein